MRAKTKNKLFTKINGAIHLDSHTQDCLFLSVVVLLSVVLYVWGLGFYSDDWSFLAYFNLSEDQSLPGIFRSVYSGHVRMRPVQILYLAILYKLFGLQPLGYHLVNSVVLISSILLFYLLLRELGFPRLLALSIPLVYGLLPHYSTNRFWYAAFQTTLSMALYFLSLYAALRVLRSRSRWLWGWQLLSNISLVCSGLGYEVVLPFFLLNPLLVWYRERQIDPSQPYKQLSKINRLFLRGSYWVSLIGLILFKALTTTRVGNNETSFVWYVLRIIKNSFSLNYSESDYGLNLKQALQVNYLEYGLGLPHIVWKLLRDYPNFLVIVLSSLVGLAIFIYLFKIATDSKDQLPTRSSMLKLIGLGLILFGLGYAIFITNYNVQFTKTGIGNRTAFAAAVGVAFSFVGALGWVSDLLHSSYWRRRCFCVLIAVLCASGFLINNTLATFWIEAYRQEQIILADIKQQFPELPSGSTVLLDGICPYIGPAIVFESNWDLQGALMIMYRNYDLRADIVNPSLKVHEDGISTSIYGGKSRYPYQQLLIYNFAQKLTYPIINAETANRYFSQYNPDYSNGCPPGQEGLGVSIF